MAFLAVNRSALCSAHPGCAGLAGDCCPGADGVFLGCCRRAANRTATAVAAAAAAAAAPADLESCNAHTACVALGLEGACCPTEEGLSLACCHVKERVAPLSIVVVSLCSVLLLLGVLRTICRTPRQLLRSLLVAIISGLIFEAMALPTLDTEIWDRLPKNVTVNYVWLPFWYAFLLSRFSGVFIETAWDSICGSVVAVLGLVILNYLMPGGTHGFPQDRAWWPGGYSEPAAWVYAALFVFFVLAADWSNCAKQYALGVFSSFIVGFVRPSDDKKTWEAVLVDYKWHVNWAGPVLCSCYMVWIAIPLAALSLPGFALPCVRPWRRFYSCKKEAYMEISNIAADTAGTVERIVFYACQDPSSFDFESSYMFVRQLGARRTQAEELLRQARWECFTRASRARLRTAWKVCGLLKELRQFLRANLNLLRSAGRPLEFSHSEYSEVQELLREFQHHCTEAFCVFMRLLECDLDGEDGDEIIDASARADQALVEALLWLEEHDHSVLSAEVVWLDGFRMVPAIMQAFAEELRHEGEDDEHEEEPEPGGAGGGVCGRCRARRRKRKQAGRVDPDWHMVAETSAEEDMMDGACSWDIPEARGEQNGLTSQKSSPRGLRYHAQTTTKAFGISCRAFWSEERRSLWGHAARNTLSWLLAFAWSRFAEDTGATAVMCVAFVFSPSVSSLFERNVNRLLGVGLGLAVGCIPARLLMSGGSTWHCFNRNDAGSIDGAGELTCWGRELGTTLYLELMFVFWSLAMYGYLAPGSKHSYACLLWAGFGGTQMLSLMQDHANRAYDPSKTDTKFARNYDGNMVGCLIVLLVDLMFVRFMRHSSVKRVAGVMPKCLDDVIGVVATLQDGDFAHARQSHLPELGKHIQKSRHWHADVQRDDLIWSASRYAPYKTELVGTMLDRCDDVYVAAWALLAGARRCQDAREASTIIRQVIPPFTVHLNVECVHAIRKTLLEKPGEDGWKHLRKSLKRVLARRDKPLQSRLRVGKRVSRPSSASAAAAAKLHPEGPRRRALERQITAVSSDFGEDLRRARSRGLSHVASPGLQRRGSIFEEAIPECEEVTLWQLLGREESSAHDEDAPPAEGGKPPEGDGEGAPAVAEASTAATATPEDMPLRLLTARSRRSLSSGCSSGGGPGAVRRQLSIKEVLTMGRAPDAGAFNAALGAAAATSGRGATAALVKTATWAVALRANAAALLRAVQSIEVLLEEHVFWAATEWRPRIQSQSVSNSSMGGGETSSSTEDEEDEEEDDMDASMSSAFAEDSHPLNAQAPSERACFSPLV